MFENVGDVEVVGIEFTMEHFMCNKYDTHFEGLLYRRRIVKVVGLQFMEGTAYGEDVEFT